MAWVRGSKVSIFDWHNFWMVPTKYIYHLQVSCTIFRCHFYQNLFESQGRQHKFQSGGTKSQPFADRYVLSGNIIDVEIQFLTLLQLWSSKSRTESFFLELGQGLSKFAKGLFWPAVGLLGKFFESQSTVNALNLLYWNISKIASLGLFLKISNQCLLKRLCWAGVRLK